MTFGACAGKVTRVRLLCWPDAMKKGARNVMNIGRKIIWAPFTMVTFPFRWKTVANTLIGIIRNLWLSATMKNAPFATSTSQHGQTLVLCHRKHWYDSFVHSVIVLSPINVQSLYIVQLGSAGLVSTYFDFFNFTWNFSEQKIKTRSFCYSENFRYIYCIGPFASTNSCRWLCGHFQHCVYHA